jgi:hypothetical protein
MAWPYAAGTTEWVCTLAILKSIRNMLLGGALAHESILLLSEKKNGQVEFAFAALIGSA